MKDTSLPRNRIIFILGLLMTVSPFAIDMYLPSFGQIATELDTTPSRVSLSVASYFIGLAFGQMLYGPLLDRYGRRKPIYFGLSLFMVASLVCAMSISLEELVIARFFQALGGCVAWVGAATMVRDFFPVQDAPRVFSLLVLVLGVSPLIAPTAGGFVAVAFGWRSIFYCLFAIAALVLLTVIFFLPDGRPPDKTVDLRPRPMLRTFMTILREPQFITCSLAGSLAFASLFTYVSGSPVIFMELYKLKPESYGILFAFISVGFIGASQLNILLSRKLRPDRVFRFVLPIQVLLGVGFLVVAMLQPPVEIAIAFIFLTLACVGVLNPNASALALAPFTRNIGSASALAGCIQISLASLVSAAVGAFSDADLSHFAALMALTPALALMVWFIGGRFIGKMILEDPVGPTAP